MTSMRTCWKTRLPAQTLGFFVKKILLAVPATLMTTAAFAQSKPGDNLVAVPEISALEGTAAIAALAAIVLFAWERRRRAA